MTSRQTQWFSWPHRTQSMELPPKTTCTLIHHCIQMKLEAARSRKNLWVQLRRCSFSLLGLYKQARLAQTRAKKHRTQFGSPILVTDIKVLETTSVVSQDAHLQEIVTLKELGIERGTQDMRCGYPKLCQLNCCPKCTLSFPTCLMYLSPM